MSGGRSFGASSLDQKMWLGQADPLYMEVGRPASGIRGGYHLPVATRIRVREGRLKSSENGAALNRRPWTAAAGGGPQVSD